MTIREHLFAINKCIKTSSVREKFSDTFEVFKRKITFKFFHYIQSKNSFVNLHGLMPVVPSRPKGQVQASLAPNLLFLAARYISL